jgi:hypothetical protein
MNKPKSDKNAGHPGPDQGGRDQYKRHVDGDITIRGQIETHFPPSVVEEQKTADKKDEAYKRKTFIAEIVTISLVTIYAGLTAWQACMTREIIKNTQENFNKSNRPFIGVNNVSALMHFSMCAK